MPTVVGGVVLSPRAGARAHDELLIEMIDAESPPSAGFFVACVRKVTESMA